MIFSPSARLTSRSVSRGIQRDTERHINHSKNMTKNILYLSSFKMHNIHIKGYVCGMECTILSIVNNGTIFSVKCLKHTFKYDVIALRHKSVKAKLGR